MQHLLRLQRKGMRMRAGQQQVDERGKRVLLTDGRRRRRRTAGEAGGGDLWLEEEVDAAALTNAGAPGGGGFCRKPEVDDRHRAVRVDEHITRVDVGVDHVL